MTDEQIELTAGIIYTSVIIGKAIFPEKIEPWESLPNHDRLKPICRKAAVDVLRALFGD